MQSSLLTLQISINIPQLCQGQGREGGGGGGACRTPFYTFIIHYEMVQAAKLWLPELSSDILVLRKKPRPHCLVVTCFRTN